jgi:hypothetical protein
MDFYSSDDIISHKKTITQTDRAKVSKSFLFSLMLRNINFRSCYKLTFKISNTTKETKVS